MLTIIGLGNDRKSACVLTIEKIDWEWLKDNAPIAHLMAFRHRATDWGGRDELPHTLLRERLDLTGDEIHLEKPITFKGVNYDMGNSYSWSFDVYFLLECFKRY